MVQQESLPVPATGSICRAHPVSMNRYGCRVLERLICCGSKAPGDSAHAQLCDALLAVDVLALITHRYANHVLQSIVEYGLQRHRSRVVETLLTSIDRFCSHRIASHVVQKALCFSGDPDRERLCAAIEALPAALLVPKRPSKGYG